MPMQTVPLRRAEHLTSGQGIALLLADDDAGMRSLVSASVRGLEILEAEDGAEAIQRGLQQQPQLALLDVNMPLVDGIEAAIVLRELLPQLRLALYSGDTDTHRERAHDLGLPLFDKSDLDRATRWISAQAEGSLGRPAWRRQPPKSSLVPASGRRADCLIPCDSSRGVAQPG
jgi:CheY-like chemotaxis protein